MYESVIYSLNNTYVEKCDFKHLDVSTNGLPDGHEWRRCVKCYTVLSGNREHQWYSFCPGRSLGTIIAIFLARLGITPQSYVAWKQRMEKRLWWILFLEPMPYYLEQYYYSERGSWIVPVMRCSCGARASALNRWSWESWTAKRLRTWYRNYKANGPFFIRGIKRAWRSR